MKTVILDGRTLNPGDLSWSGFEEIGELTVYDRTDVNDEEEILKRIGDAEIVITNKTPLTRSTIMRAGNMKYIGVLATGYNIVDVEAANERGIPVTNVPSYGTDAVAQFTMALLLEIANRVGHHDMAVKAGRWASSPDFSFWDHPLMELHGKTMGIVGFGRIGQETARLARAFGMNIIAYSRTVKPELEDECCRFADLDTLFEKSDVISLHCPLSEKTRGVINKESISKMKDGVIILNTARGPLVCEEDLAEALNSGKVYAAGLDVASEEPLRSDTPLLHAKNCYMTPHIAWASKESRERLLSTAVSNAAEWARTGIAPNRVLK